MAHDLFKDTMVYVDETPWHGLGRRVSARASAAEFLIAGGLNWRVQLAPAPGAKEDAKGRWSRMTIYRDAVGDEPEPVALGMVSNRYTVLQNPEAFAFFDPLIRTGWATYEAAGALGDGETVWVQVRLRDDIEVQPGDRVRRYLLLRNRHNGEGAVAIRFTPVRVVCQNTLSLAELRSRAFASVRHSRNMHLRLQDVSADTVQREVEAFSARSTRVFKAMVERQLTPDERLVLLDDLCGKPPKAPSPSGLPTRRDLVDQRLTTQSSVDALAGDQSAWALYNAITWAEDERARLRGSKDPEAGLTAKWFGAGAEHKQKAFERLAGVVLQSG
jgi:phage/plasmid-like protein (TIGR03299 family)